MPRTAGNGEAVPRNRHHVEALGKGDPQCFAGMAGAARFAVGDAVLVRDLPTIFYTRTQEYLRGNPGTVVKVSYESPAAEDEAFDREDHKPEWFYIVRFKMTDLWDPYQGAPTDTLQAEIPERWLEPDRTEARHSTSTTPTPNATRHSWSKRSPTSRCRRSRCANWRLRRVSSPPRTIGTTRSSSNKLARCRVPGWWPRPGLTRISSG